MAVVLLQIVLIARAFRSETHGCLPMFASSISHENGEKQKKTDRDDFSAEPF